jgi:hypothetical protein
MVVTSLKPVPQDVKNKLKSLGIEVVDYVYPGGFGEKQLIDYVKQALFSKLLTKPKTSLYLCCVLPRI